MYRPPAFAVDDPQTLAAFVGAHPFALLAVNGDAGPVIAHVPMIGVTDGEGALVELIGHVARANPFWTVAEGAQALAVFSGGDAYVSPSFYPSKAAHGRVVPTWNYLRVEVRGAVALETDPSKMAPYLQAPTHALEAGRTAPWAMADAPADYIAKLSHAVVGLRIAAAEIVGVAKLSQNKDAADHAGVVAGLRASDRPSDRAVAEAMVGACNPFCSRSSPRKRGPRLWPHPSG